MKNKIKIYLIFGVVISLAIIYQIKYGNQGSILVPMFFLSGVGLGWYACKSYQETSQNCGNRK